jgi:hypothetical protein
MTEVQKWEHILNRMIALGLTEQAEKIRKTAENIDAMKQQKKGA